jgi:2-methylcitrate dehydratase
MTSRELASSTNQSAGIAEFAVAFLAGFGEPNKEVIERVVAFHTDAVVCGLSAVGLGTRAPVVFAEEALEYPAPLGTIVRCSLRPVPYP